jgi:hypothetical protein
VVKSYFAIPQFSEAENASRFRYFEVDIISNPKKNADIFVGLVPSTVDLPETIDNFEELMN